MSSIFGGSGVISAETGDATQVAFFNGATTLDGSSTFTWDDGAGRLSVSGAGGIRAPKLDNSGAALVLGTATAHNVSFQPNASTAGTLLSTGEWILGDGGTTLVESVSIVEFRRNTNNSVRAWTINNTNGTSAVAHIGAKNSANIDISMEAHASLHSSRADVMRVITSTGAAELRLETSGTTPVTVQVGGAERTRIPSTGELLVNKTTVTNSGQLEVSGKIYGSAALELDGDLDHDGSNIGFFGVSPVARASAYTQTYSTADKTHAAFTSADLATTAATNAAPWGFASQAQAENIATQFNLLRADVADAKQLINSVIDDLQAYGLQQ